MYMKDPCENWHESYEQLGHGQDSRKCPKETSSGPQTVAAHPPASKETCLVQNFFRKVIP